MFPCETLEAALDVIRRGFQCKAEICDGDMIEWQGKTARVDTGLMYHGDRQIGTFGIVSVRDQSRQRQIVAIRVGAVGEMVANPITAAQYDEWVSELQPWR